MIKPWQAGVAGTVVVIAGAAALLWWQRQPPPLVAPAPPPAVEPEPVAQAPEPPAPPPPIQHPIEAAAAASQPAAPVPGLPPLAESNDYVKDALAGLVGRQAMLTLLQTDNFPSRVVVTVDNLARDHASPRLWPVNPVDGRFAVDQRDGRDWLSARNASRYSALVKFVESVDTKQAVALYVQMYPLFQQAYEELGYPGRYFNDRLVEVIDHLLATPDLNAPVELSLTEVKGPYATEKPWVNYHYVDDRFEARSSGQKMLLRVGSANAQRLKAELRQIRALITKAPVGANAAPASR